jgi:hypothetical protein
MTFDPWESSIEESNQRVLSHSIAIKFSRNEGLRFRGKQFAGDFVKLGIFDHPCHNPYLENG